jgi:hypothetical protein
MSAYVATARIERATPRLVLGREPGANTWDWVAQNAPADLREADIGAESVVDPLIERLSAVRDRWSQLTFYLFDAEGWR